MKRHYTPNGHNTSYGSFDFLDETMSSPDALDSVYPPLSSNADYSLINDDDQEEFSCNWEDWATNEQFYCPQLFPQLSCSLLPAETSALRNSFAFSNSFSNSSISEAYREPPQERPSKDEDSTLDSSVRDVSDGRDSMPARRRAPKKADEFLHSCPIPQCNKSYRRKGDLKFHVIHKHPNFATLPTSISKPKSDKEGKNFPCPVPDCKCGFKWHRDLRRHFKTKHQELSSQLEAYEQMDREEEEEDVQFDEKFEAQWKLQGPTCLLDVSRL
jgi:hypothetical protein